MIGFSTTLTTSDVVLALDRHVVEQAGGEQALERLVDLLRVVDVPGRNAR